MNFGLWLCTAVQQWRDDARLFPRHVSKLAVVVPEHQNRVRVVAVVGFAFQADDVTHQQSLAGLASRRVAKCTMHCKLLPVQYASPSIRRVPLRAFVAALGDQRLSPAFTLRYASSLTDLLSSECRLRADLFRKDPLNSERNTIKLLFRDLAIRGDLIDLFIQEWQRGKVDGSIDLQP